MTFSTTALSIIGFASVNQHNNTVLRVIIYLSESYRHSDDRELIPDLLKPPAEPEIHGGSPIQFQVLARLNAA